MSLVAPELLLLAPPFEARGICAYTVRLARGLIARKFAVQVLTSDSRGLDPQIRRELPVREWKFAHLPLLGSLQAAVNTTVEFPTAPKLIHVQSPRMLGLGNELARRLRVPYVITVHHLPNGCPLAVHPTWCRRVIAASDAVAGELARRGDVPLKLITVIPPGVEVDPPQPHESPLDPRHAPVIGAAGPLEADKGLPWFLGAARSVLNAIPGVEFVIAGSGGEEANLRRLTRELELSSQVTFAPYLFDFQYSLQAMDVFCLPAVRQGLSSIMLEAMALGLPVVASTVGGIDSVIEDGVCGLLVPPQNLRALSDALIRLLRDPALARRLGAAGRERVRNAFCVEQMVARTVEVYSEVLESPTWAAA